MENNKREVQVDRAISYMREHGSLTSYEAVMELGIMSFPKRVCEMKERGFYIATKWENLINRYGKKIKVKRYFLIEEKEVAQ